MNKEEAAIIVDRLSEVIIDPKPELDFKNNYELIISVVLSAQTKDKRVNEVTKDLFKEYPDFKSLSLAEEVDVINMIKSLGLAKNKAKSIIELSKIIVSKYNSILPNKREELETLPGVGRKTANVVLALGFNIPAIPVDTHVKRVAYRLGFSDPNDDVIKVEEKLMNLIDKDKWILSHHLFLLFGRYHCLSNNPKCSSCKLSEFCNQKQAS